MQRTVGAMIKRNSVAVVTWLLALLTLLAQPIDGAPAAVRASAQHAAGGTVRITGLLARPTTALAGSSVILQTAVAAQTAFRALIVSIEVYGPTWKSVYAIRASVDIAAQGSRSVAASWSIPSSEATGTYHALVNVFSGDWTIHYAERCCIDLHVTNASGAIALGAWVPGADSIRPLLTSTRVSRADTPPSSTTTNRGYLPTRAISTWGCCENTSAGASRR